VLLDVGLDPFVGGLVAGGARTVLRLPV